MFSSRGGALSLLPGARWGRGVPGELRCRAWGGLLAVSVDRLTRTRRFSESQDQDSSPDSLARRPSRTGTASGFPGDGVAGRFCKMPFVVGAGEGAESSGTGAGMGELRGSGQPDPAPHRAVLNKSPQSQRWPKGVSIEMRTRSRASAWAMSIRGYDSNGAKSNAKVCWTRSDQAVSGLKGSLK